MSETPQQSIPHYELAPVECIKQAFHLFNKAPGIIILCTILLVIVQILCTRLPGVGTIVSMLISPLLMAGMYGVLSKVDQTGAASLNDAIDAIKSSKLDQLMLVGIVAGILTGLGFVFLFFPGLYLAIAYSFATLYVFFQRMPFWDAMEKSRRVITEKWFSFFGLAILVGLLNVAGAIFLGLGLIVTVPVSLATFYVAFRRVTDQIEKPAPAVQAEIVAAPTEP